MTKKNNQLKKKEKKVLKKAVKNVLQGKGDYTLKKLDDAYSAIDDIDRRLMKQEQKKGLGSGIGSKIGGMLGNSELGSKLGGMAETSLGRLFGFGDYTISQNSLMKAAISQDMSSANIVPQFGTHGRGVRLQEREYIGDIVSGALVNGSSTFTNIAFTINPLNQQTFPWLSTFAANFEEWEPHGLVFEFKSTSSEFNGTSQALGTVIMATDYDVYDTTYSSKIEMETADYSNSTKSSCTAMHGVECDPTERATKILYVGTGQPDQRLNALGNFQLATVGCSTANVTLGELWVSYDISFYKKQLGATSQMASYIFGSSDPANPFLLPQVVPASIGQNASPQSYGLTLAFSGLDVIFPTWLPVGSTWELLMYQGAGSAAVQFTGINTFTNCTGGGSAQTTTSSTPMFSRAFDQLITITGSPAKVTVYNCTAVTQTRVKLRRVNVNEAIF
jgi:hypothetical protein